MPSLECIRLHDKSTVTPPASAVLCLGNFDGVHVAHRALIERTLALRNASAPNAVCGVFCFREPSWCFLSKDSSEMLCTLEQKLDLFYQAGAEYAYIADFSEISHFSPLAFLEQVLLKECHTVGCVCGFNYRFGTKGQGSKSDIISFFGDKATVLDEVVMHSETVSSTRIRTLLKQGKIELANELLGRPFGFTAAVVHGKALGKRLGAPTVNQHIPNRLLVPKRGVYATRCIVDGTSYAAVSNVGIHPTVDKDAPVNCETYLFNFEGDLYGRALTISFLHFIRPEQRFTSAAQLAKQIQLDIQAARSFANREDII